MSTAAAASRPTKTEELTSITAPSPAKNDEEVELSADNSIDCIICLETFPRSSRAPQRCSHNVCKACFSQYLTVTIKDSCVGFPRCPEPSCHVAASDQLISEFVQPELACRMRQLRGLHPARAKDGRRMWCVAPGCFEPLPPPFVENANNNNNNAANGNNNEAHNNNNQAAPRPVVPPPQSECGKCGTVACLRCGSAAHPGTACVAPTTCLRQQRMYAQYAVDRIAACEQCGAHVERNGGCSQMVCWRCGHSFTFRPFTSVAQVQQSLAFVNQEVQRPVPRPGRHGALNRLMALRRGDAEMYLHRIHRRHGLRPLYGGRRRILDTARLNNVDPPADMARAVADAARVAADAARANRVTARANVRANARANQIERRQTLQPIPAQLPPNRIRLTAPRGTYDYISDEELDMLEQDLDLYGGDEAWLPRHRVHGERGHAAAAAGTAANSGAELRAMRGLRPEVAYDPLDRIYGHRRRLENARLAAQDLAAQDLAARDNRVREARRMEQARRYNFYGAEENGRDEFPELWPEMMDGYPALVPRDPGHGIGYVAPRRRASTGGGGVAAGEIGRVDGRMRVDGPPARPSVRRRTLSELEGATMPPPPIRRRTSAEGGGAVRGRGNARFARVERGEAAGEERSRRREAIRRQLTRSRGAAQFGNDGGLPEPEI